PDAVFANGNSGDFISGAHIRVGDGSPVPTKDSLATIIEALSEKHFSLWQSLRTSKHLAAIEAQIRASLDRAGAEPGCDVHDFGIYEYAEFQDRQCKYVIGGQRIYEFLGYAWRLPLWDNDLIAFFERMPREAKVGQRLYADTLEGANWGGVWQDVPVNARTIKPNWIRPLRFMAKVAHAPVGKDAWHKFEKRYFGYWMELSGQSAIRSYTEVANDRRGARYGVAWLTEDYLSRHGLDYAGNLMS
ncbi:MAG: asparagine synthase, partial [Pseudomonadota bacterium]|nr:asparagine synthase [Pseudomonadota bacterium]